MISFCERTADKLHAYKTCAQINDLSHLPSYYRRCIHILKGLYEKDFMKFTYLVHIHALMSLFYVNIRLYTNIMLIPFYSHCYTPVSALKGPSSGNTDTFREQGQQKCMSRCKYQITEQRVVCYYHKSNIVIIILLQKRPWRSKGGVEVYLYSFFNLGRK
jgi:hypothetical protein